MNVRNWLLNGLLLIGESKESDGNRKAVDIPSRSG